MSILITDPVANKLMQKSLSLWHKRYATQYIKRCVQYINLYPVNALNVR